MSREQLTQSLSMIIAGQSWKLFSIKKSGEVLIKGASSKFMEVRQLSGKMLVQAGKKSIPLIREALERGVDSPILRKALKDLEK